MENVMNAESITQTQSASALLHVKGKAVAGVAFHAFERLFVRLAPFILIGALAGVFLTRKK